MLLLAQVRSEGGSKCEARLHRNCGLAPLEGDRNRPGHRLTAANQPEVGGESQHTMDPRGGDSLIKTLLLNMYSGFQTTTRSRARSALAFV
jgi:hypothetical protein